MRFSIRSLMILTYIAGFAFLFGTYYYRNLEATPKYAAEQLRSFGGEVDSQINKYGVYTSSIDLSRSLVESQHLKFVRTLTPQYKIDLSNTEISDAGLLYLHGARARKIDLTGTNVTKLGVARLKETLDPATRVEFGNFWGAD